jgi:hypothetical protein
MLGVAGLVEMSEELLTEEHTSTTDFTMPKKVTKFGKAQTDSVITEAWFDTAYPQTPSLWLRSKDGDLVCVPFNRLGLLKKLLRRGRNP